MFAHVGLLVDTSGQKLSKRHKGVNIDWYKQERILPPALLNFAALLGWGRPDDHEMVMGLQDMVDKVWPTQPHLRTRLT